MLRSTRLATAISACAPLPPWHHVPQPLNPDQLPLVLAEQQPAAGTPGAHAQHASLAAAQPQAQQPSSAATDTVRATRAGAS